MSLKDLTKERGDSLLAVDWNDLSNRASAMMKGASGQGVKVSVGPGGISIMGTELLEFHEPAIVANAYNAGISDLEPFDICQITLPVQLQSQTPDNTGSPLDKVFQKTQRVVEITKPLDWCFGRFGVCAQSIPQEKVGRIWITGAVFCLVSRLFDVYGESYQYRKPDRADTVRGETYLQASELGAAQILWIFEPLNPVWTTRPAIIRFDSRNTSGIGIYEYGNMDNGGVAEVLEFNEKVTVTKKADGVVLLEITP